MAVFHLLDPQELDFDFRRPMRFLDMEGGPAIFAEPNEIAERYHGRWAATSKQMQQVVLESAVDYHRVDIDEELRAGVVPVPGRSQPQARRPMSFLQPLLLAALPLAALPIIIHLINQRRYQTVRWAAMMFLLAANRMSRGYRPAPAMADLAVPRAGRSPAWSSRSARPLAGGWLGLAGGRPTPTRRIILLDRSPSMQQQDAGAGQIEAGHAGRRQLVADAPTLRLLALGADRERDKQAA